VTTLHPLSRDARADDGVDLTGVTTLLVDADGTLFPSEEPAYAASVGVTNRFLADLGAGVSYEAEELQRLTNGKNFRATATDLAVQHGKPLRQEDLDAWVTEEKDVVTTHLRTVLSPDPRVSDPVAALGARFVLAAVTSSALSRCDACLEVTGLAEHFAPERRFSAEDSLPVPMSKPDPAVYAMAGRTLGVSTAECLAIEDSVNGTLSAVSAGYRTVGTVQFVAPEDRATRTDELLRAGAVAVVGDLAELVTWLSGGHQVECGHRSTDRASTVV
jgi:beta-phosphoglucomutase-like phosphatase (HAD superfamily)